MAKIGLICAEQCGFVDFVGLYSSGGLIRDVVIVLMRGYIACSREFSEFLQPHLKKNFSLRGKSSDVDSIFWSFNQLNRGNDKVVVDELHTLIQSMLCYTFERELLGGKLSVEDLPEAWKMGVEHYYVEGSCDPVSGLFMLDEWVDGRFGYAPARAIISVVAAQIFDYGRKNIHDITKGDLSCIISWISTVLSSAGDSGIFTTIKSFTGSDIDLSTYERVLQEKYLRA